MDEIAEEKRLDVIVCEKINCGREWAKELIEKEKVKVNGKIITKAGFKTFNTAEIIIDEPENKYVSRGGYKLKHAIDAFNIKLDGKNCIDIGASTGGFTDCMLQHGAKKVYAIDVGTSQLHESLLNNEKIVNMEKTNIKDEETINKINQQDFISIDVSFISLTKILDIAKKLLNSNGEMVLLVKPQFEVGKKAINKNGVVNSEKERMNAIKIVYDYCKLVGMSVLDGDKSPVIGHAGNIEYLFYVNNNGESMLLKDLIDKCKA